MSTFANTLNIDTSQHAHITLLLTLCWAPIFWDKLIGRVVVVYGVFEHIQDNSLYTYTTLTLHHMASGLYTFTGHHFYTHQCGPVQNAPCACWDRLQTPGAITGTSWMDGWKVSLNLLKYRKVHWRKIRCAFLWGHHWCFLKSTWPKCPKLETENVWTWNTQTNVKSDYTLTCCWEVIMWQYQILDLISSNVHHIKWSDNGSIS